MSICNTPGTAVDTEECSGRQDQGPTLVEVIGVNMENRQHTSKHTKQLQASSMKEIKESDLEQGLSLGRSGKLQRK